MTTTTTAPEQEHEPTAPPEQPVRFNYGTRTILIVRIVAAVLSVPFLTALFTRSTGWLALLALALAAGSAGLLLHVQRRVSGRADAVVAEAAGLSLIGGGRAGILSWSDITAMRHSRIRGLVRFGTKMNPNAATVDADLEDFAGFLDVATLHIDAARRGENVPPQGARADTLFRRSTREDVIMLALALAGVVLGLALRPALFVLAGAAGTRLLWHWMTAPNSVAVDDTAVWIIRPLARDVIPLRAIRDVGFGIHGRFARLAITIEHRDRGPIVIDGFNAAALPIFDAIVAARARERTASRTGPAAARTGSAMRRAGSTRDALKQAAGVLLAFVCIAWITVLTGIPLRNATRYGNTIIVRAALLLGPPLESADGDGLTALHHAAVRSDVRITRALLDRGADANASTEDGLTPLHIAAQRGHRGVVELLIAGGADVNARTARSRTPLAHAALTGAQGDTGVARMMLDARADTDVADSGGRTPLHHAAFNGHADLLRRLVRSGALIEAADTLRQRPLHLAVLRNQQRTIEALLDGGAEVDARGHGGRTALAHAAAGSASVAAVNLLLDAGADTGIPDDDGWNAVQLATRANNVEMLTLFARRRASLNATDGRVAPALWLAVDNGHTEAARALLRGGASPYVRWNSRSAIDLARSKRNATIVALMQMR